VSTGTGEARAVVEADLKRCDNGLIWHDTKVDEQGVVTFMYGTFPEHEVPAFVDCMKRAGYALSTHGLLQMTNFGVRPDAAAQATVEQTEAIIKAEREKQQKDLSVSSK
jgi:hypothetical protein